MISRKIRMKLLRRHSWPQQRTIVAYLERPGEGQNQTPEMACIGPWHETADHLTALHRLLDSLCLSGAPPSMQSACACDLRRSFLERDRGAHDGSTSPISTYGSYCCRTAGRLACCECARLSKPDRAHRRRLSPWTGNRHLGAPDG